MKKTLVTLMALASCAMGADLVAGWDEFTNLSYVNGENTYTLTLNSGSSVNVETGDMWVDGANGVTKLDLTGAGLTFADGFTVHMQVKGIANSGGNTPFGLFSVATAGNSYAALAGVRTDVAGYPATFCYDGSVNKITTTQVSGTTDNTVLASDVFTYVTVTMAEGAFNFYMNGELVATASKTGLMDGEITSLGLGGWAGGSANSILDYTLGSLAVYDGAMSAAEVKGLIIPEPATATLSLLALAGLAARRRRR